MGIENFKQQNQVDLIDTKGEPTFESLSDAELETLYKEHVGYTYRYDLKREELIKVLRADKEDEISRLREIDIASDKKYLNPRGN